MKRRERGKWWWFLPVTFTTIIFWISFLPQSWSKSLNAKVVSGIYSEDLPAPIAYDSYTTIVLEFVTPKFKPTDITFNNWYNCTTEKYPYSLSCPVVFHLNSAIKNFHTDFESIQPGKDDEHVEKSAYFDRLLTSSSFCQKIQSHFAGIYTHSRDLDRYLEALEQCSLQELFIHESMGGVTNTFSTNKRFYLERNITDYSYNVRAPFSRMETNYYDAFYRPVSNLTNPGPGTKLLASAALSNSRTALQGSLLAAFYAERNRWMHSISSCRSHHLPHALVNETRLRNILSNIRTALSSGGGVHYHELSIPLESLSAYFSLPLTDCTHTKDSFIVRLQVPLIQTKVKAATRGEEIGLRLIRNVPFLLNAVKICRIKGLKDQSTFLSVGAAAFETQCRPNELCDISASVLSSTGSLCMSTVYSNRIPQLDLNCPLECLDRATLPIINSPAGFSPIFVQRISPKRFVLMGKPRPGSRQSIQITCQVNENQSETFAVDLGDLPLAAVEIEFSCNCQLFLPSAPSISTKRARNDNGQEEEEAMGYGRGYGQVFRPGILTECRGTGRPFYEIFQIVPWHLLKRDKRLEYFKTIKRNVNGSEEEEEFMTASSTSNYQPFDLEVFNEHVQNILDFDLINQLAPVKSDSDAKSTTENTQDYDTLNSLPRNEKMSGSSQEKSNRGFNWTFFITFLMMGILFVGQIILFYYMNQVRGTPYFSLPNRVLYKSTTAPTLISEENE